MNNGFFSRLKQVMRNTARIGSAVSVQIFARMRQMSWLQIALIALGVAVAIVVLHLALFLFLVFMVVKLVLVTLFFAGGKAAPAAKHSEKEPYTIEMESTK